jgi:CBS domain containing-hemolysin-like protein
MPTQLHSQARMMQFLAIVTSLVSFFRSLGGILALTIMSSVVNNKISDAFASSSLSNNTSSSSSSLNSLGSIQSLPPDTLSRVQDAFSDAIRWAYIALLPFVCIAAISAFFLREVKIERSVEDERRREAERNGDGEMGTSATESSTPVQSGVDGGSAVVGRKPRTKIYGPIGVIIWCCQAIGDKMGWRK